jgi:predicted  nucleic acid-binding Zn-ribbon protein
MKQDHLNKIQAEQEGHRKEIEVKNTQIDQMRREIKQIERENGEILQQIRDDTEFEKGDITKKNDQNKTTVNDISLKSKADVQLNNNKLQDIE